MNPVTLSATRSLIAWALLGLAFASSAASAQRAPAEAEHGMVASASVLASEIGVEVLKRGGNAADAAVATALALAVTYPRAGNIGGGGFALLRLADGRVTSIDFRETAPAAANADLYLDSNGNVVPSKSTVGHAASAIPGTIAGLELLHERYGSHRLSWSQLVEPARQLAAKGFAVTPALARDITASTRLLERFESSRSTFLRNGKPYRAGETLTQPELAATFRRLQKHGAKEFYTGKTAELIVKEMADHGGLITAEDLASYRAVEREPLRGTYRGYEIITMPPPSSGGIALLQMLTMLESRDVRSLGLNSAARIHLFTEVMRRAFQDRAEWLGDPDFVSVPVSRLLDRAYITERMASFDPQRATPSLPAKAAAAVRESAETTHFSVVDPAGNAIAVTYTLNGLWGNGVTVGGAGFLLNNEMDDFTSKVGVRNSYGLLQSDSNAIAPRKRPLSSMTPTLVLKDGKPFLVTGSPGGPTIINTVFLVITNVVDFSLSVTQAVDAPRFHHQWMPDMIQHEPFFTSPDTVALLEQRGHRLQLRRLYPNAPEAEARSWGDAETILIDPKSGMRLGARDLRSADSAALGW
jgi:gamma-glutamyltranspeptidase/glutathione hydrolase